MLGIDIGERQLGRLAPKNVKNVEFDYKKIMKEVNLILNKKNHKEINQNPYNVRHFKKNILQVAKNIFKREK